MKALRHRVSLWNHDHMINKNDNIQSLYCAEGKEHSGFILLWLSQWMDNNRCHWHFKYLLFTILRNVAQLPADARWLCYCFQADLCPMSNTCAFTHTLVCWRATVMERWSSVFFTDTIGVGGRRKTWPFSSLTSMNIVNTVDLHCRVSTQRESRWPPAAARHEFASDEDEREAASSKGYHRLKEDACACFCFCFFSL